ncbi:hypothetical protein GGS24DRAFT_439001 [Hypoxylon argillaceum]|nr:hypothetical protein GGS24DRAFT_439001 [Hypoxylon argillaceum]
MPSATQHTYSMVSPSARKRRREDDGELQIPPFSSTLEASQNLLSAINSNERLVIPSSRGSTSLFSVPRKAIPLSLSKKLRLVEDNHHEQPNTNYFHHLNTPPSALSPPQQSHFSHAHPEHGSATTRTNSAALLSPCHICHRKPTKKSDLDSFADCTGCGERTCFVCLRACQGWLPASEEDESSHIIAEGEDLSASFTMHDADDEDTTHSYNHRVVKPEQKQKKGEGGRDREKSWSGSGHRRVICSQCCIEQGSEGDIVCLGCLAGKGA